jgi:thiol:disulfide interchange protein DsbC
MPEAAEDGLMKSIRTPNFASRLMPAVLAIVAFPTLGATSVAELHAQLAKHLPGVNVEDVRESEVPGLFELRMGETSAYVTADAKYLVRGDLFEIASRRNLSEVGRSAERRALLARVDPKQAITFGPADAKHTVTVFTDIECPYCRKLHSEVGLINALGIAVRYVAYPRGGPGTEAWTQMEAVWCSSDRQDALTRAKQGQQIAPTVGCAANPVTAQFELGQKLRIQGTPLVILEDGRVAGGYVPPEELAKLLSAPRRE